MKRNPRLQLPEDPNINIWNYYPIMKITPIVMDNFLLIILTIPLTDQSLEMNLYKVYNLPALHPKLKVEFTYELEGEYLAITKNKLYAALPTPREIRICKGTGGYLCLMNQALYPIDKLEWCIYALFTNNEKKKREYCSINTHKRDANKAQSLEGYLWAITAFEPGKMQIRCLTDTHVIDIKPPLTIIYVMPPQSWGDRSDTKHSKCLLLGGRRLNQLTLIPKPKGSGGARAATAQVGPANKRNDTKRCLPIEASLRPGEAVPW